MQDTTTITLPIPPDTLGIFAFAVLLVIGSYIIFLMLPPEAGTKHKSPMQRMEESFGIKLESRLTAALLFVALFAYIMIFFAALLIAVRGLGGIVFVALPEVMSPTQPRVSLAFGTLLAAILGAPFLVWRTYVAAKQTAIAEESLFNDKINAAATDLAARRQVTRSVGKGDTETILTEWQDDLVTRAAAIVRLEGLALERADVGPRIARMLSIYVQELSREYPPNKMQKQKDPLDLATASEIPTPIRSDCERAVQSLGRMNPKDPNLRRTFNPLKNIDLRACNLQGYDLQNANPAGARLLDAHLDAADLWNANFEGADARGASFNDAFLKDTSLVCAFLQGASFVESKLHGACFDGALLDHSILSLFNIPKDASFRGTAISSITWGSPDPLKSEADRLGIFYPGQSLQPDEFNAQWRSFAAALDPLVTIAPDYKR